MLPETPNVGPLTYPFHALALFREIEVPSKALEFTKKRPTGCFGPAKKNPTSWFQSAPVRANNVFQVDQTKIDKGFSEISSNVRQGDSKADVEAYV